VLIDAGELTVALASAQPPALLDVRWSLGGTGHAEYAAGHLPGAVFLDLDAVLAGPPGDGGRHPLPDPGVLQAALRDAGVRAGHPVVVYDAGGPSPTGAAARAWWTLRWAGHDLPPDVGRSTAGSAALRPLAASNVRVLDGGYAAWVAAGRPVSTEKVERPPGDFVARPGALPELDADGAARLAEAGRLIDARVAPRFRGEVEPVDPVAGHIPGAVNQPAADTVDPQGRLLAPAELRARFAALGLPPGATVGVYCGSGVTAAHTALALTVAGYDPLLYVGSWSHWITDPSRAVAR
jgi:thiosulfate/3-mercaptopyruvate sulfurtransferase